MNKLKLQYLPEIGGAGGFDCEFTIEDLNLILTYQTTVVSIEHPSNTLDEILKAIFVKLSYKTGMMS